MLTTYKAVTLDGQEHEGLDQFALKQWYFARRLKPDSFVLSSETGEWKLLKNLFDPAEWEAEERKTRGLGPEESIYIAPSQPSQQLSRPPEATSQTPYIYSRVNELGLRAAGILMLINAACTFVSLAIIAGRQNGSSSSGVWGFSILMDIYVGAKLLRSDNASKWQKFALVRVSLGALLFGVVLMIIGPNDAVRLVGFLEIVFCSSFYILLLGQASRARVTAGVLTFLISICGLFGVLALKDLSGNQMAKREVLKYALPDRSFIDLPSGGRVELPDGWVMLPADNPVVPRSDANMIAVHADTESYATVRIFRNSEGPDLDVVLSNVVAAQRKREPSVVELERVNSLFGRLDGRKALLTWQFEGTAIRGDLTVARNGSYYIFLNEWCAAATYSKSRAQFAALEAAASAGEPQPEPFSAIRGATY